MRFIDSHTAGEPTRVIVDGGPDLGAGSLSERRDVFARDFDSWRRSIILEPRGFDALVGALLCAPMDPSCVAGVIFFNNAGYLGMCGHGAIGVAVTLAYLGRIGPGMHRLETPVGVVTMDLKDDHTVSIENVPSYRYLEQVSVEVEGHGVLHGDVAWGGNWFFLGHDAGIPLDVTHLRELMDLGEGIKAGLRRAGITGKDGAEIDHVELFGLPWDAGANGRNFVLCPGGQYDRSPCGTGTSAKVACLAAAGMLQPGETWIQEGILGSPFEATYRLDGEGRIVPRITGRAYVCAEGQLLRQPGDPFIDGIE